MRLRSLRREVSRRVIYASRPTILRLIRSFFVLGTIAFGSGMFALIYEWVVEDNNWMNDEEFRDAVTYSELAPGPFTIHVVMYVGYHLQGWRGLVACTLAFCLPSALLIGIVVVTLRSNLLQFPGKEYFVWGLWAAIVASMVSALIRIGHVVFTRSMLFFLAALNFVLIFCYQIDFAILVGLTGLLYAGVRAWIARSAARGQNP